MNSIMETKLVRKLVQNGATGWPRQARSRLGDSNTWRNSLTSLTDRLIAVMDYVRSADMKGPCLVDPKRGPENFSPVPLVWLL